MEVVRSKRYTAQELPLPGRGAREPRQPGLNENQLMPIAVFGTQVVPITQRDSARQGLQPVVFPVGSVCEAFCLSILPPFVLRWTESSTDWIARVGAIHKCVGGGAWGGRHWALLTTGSPLTGAGLAPSGRGVCSELYVSSSFSLQRGCFPSPQCSHTLLVPVTVNCSL